MSDIIEVSSGELEIIEVDSGAIEIIELAIQGPQGIQGETGPAGTTDHGALTGLSDDDHSQYHTDGRGDARYAPIAKGVTNGDSHDHNGGDGGQISYANL